jgi:hypothetical protein
MSLINHLFKITEDAKEGLTDPIKAYIELYEIEKAVAELRKEISDLALDKRTSIPDKDWVQNGYKVSTVSTSRFSYPFDTDLERHKLAISNRQRSMKQSYYASRKGQDFYDEFGELVPPAEQKTTTYLKLEYNE